MIKLKFNKYSEEHPFGWSMPFTSDVIEDMSCYKWEGGWVSTVSRLSAQLAEDEHVITLELGKRHSIIVTSKDRLYSVGDHDFGQLGRPLIERPIIDTAKLLAAHEIQRPRRAFTDWKIAEICCGDEHTLMRCRDGAVFGWGANKYGQLGLGHFEPIVHSPAINHYLSKKVGNPTVISLRSGACYGAALTSSGTVYTWGWGTALGLGPLSSTQQHVCTPKRVRGLADPIKQLECGLGFTLALAYTGALYGWGSNSYGQLGLEDGKARLQPLLLDALQNESHLVESISKIQATATPSVKGPPRRFFSRSESSFARSRRPLTGAKDGSLETSLPSGLNKVERISCGAFHSAAIMKSGRLFVWGRNTHGEQGTVLSGRFSMPLGETRAKEVACGVRQTFAISSAGALYGWGRLYVSANSSAFKDTFSPVLIPANRLPKALVGQTGARDKLNQSTICQEMSLHCKWSRSLSVGVLAVDDGRSHFKLNGDRSSVLKACKLKPEEFHAIMVAGSSSAEDQMTRDPKRKPKPARTLPPWVTTYMPSEEDGVERIIRERITQLSSQTLKQAEKGHRVQPTPDFVSGLFERDILLSSIAAQRSKKPRNIKASGKLKNPGKYRLCLELRKPSSSDKQKSRRYILTLEVDEVPAWALANPNTKFLKVTWSSAVKESQKSPKHVPYIPTSPPKEVYSNISNILRKDHKYHDIPSAEETLRESQRLSSKLASSQKSLCSRVETSDLWLQTSLAASAEPILLRSPQSSPSSIKRGKGRDISRVPGPDRYEPQKTPRGITGKKNPNNDSQSYLQNNRAAGSKGSLNQRSLNRKPPVPTLKTKSHNSSIHASADRVKVDTRRFSQPSLILQRDRTGGSTGFDPVCGSADSPKKSKAQSSKLQQKHSLLSKFLSRFGQRS